ncbi:hypothetical protein ACFLUV_02320 [Elusimicrobiota bacterium]
MKKIIFTLLCILPLFFIPLNASQLDIGEDIDFEYRYIEYKKEVLSSEFRQRIRLYLNGHLKENVEIGAQLHSAGIMNSTNTIVIYEGAKIDNLIPYFECAYIKINDYYNYPIAISIGKLPIKWVDGVLVNHNNLGLPSVLIEAEAPYGINVEAFHCRTRNDLLDISGIKGTGIRAIKEFGFRRAEIDYMSESYFSTQDVKRKVYGFNFTRNMHRGLEYNAFYYFMRGGIRGVPFSGRALGIYGKFEGVIDPIGKGGAWIRYVMGTGDANDDERGFLPVLSSVEASYIGDYYGRYRNFRVIDKVLSDSVSLSHSIANLSVLRQALYATIKDELSVFMIRSTYKSHTPSLPLAGSLTFGGLYEYSFIDFELKYTVFAPEDNYNRYKGVRKVRFVTAVVSAKF